MACPCSIRSKGTVTEWSRIADSIYAPSSSESIIVQSRISSMRHWQHPEAVFVHYLKPQGQLQTVAECTWIKSNCDQELWETVLGSPGLASSARHDTLIEGSGTGRRTIEELLES